jgi:hypothetical protein
VPLPDEEIAASGEVVTSAVPAADLLGSVKH